MKTEKTLTIKISLLKKIAEYYEFPFVVFLGNLKCFPKKKTRNQQFREAYEKLEKIKEVLEDD